MSKLSFTFGYGGFARYLYGNCDSEQMTDSKVNESWLYRNMDEYIKTKGPWKNFSFDQYKPKELGNKSALDFVAFQGNTDLLSVCLEAKLLVDDKRNFLKEILEDIFRLLSVKDKTTSKTKRLILIVGQRRILENKWFQSNEEMLSNVLPLPKDIENYGLFQKIKNTIQGTSIRNISLQNFSTNVKDSIFPDICEAIKQTELPTAFKVKLLAFRTGIPMNEEEKASIMFAGIWQIYPLKNIEKISFLNSL